MSRKKAIEEVDEVEALDKARILILGPSREAVSGVSTHVNMLMSAKGLSQYKYSHFQVGSEGRNEGLLDKLVRFVVSPLALARAIHSSRPAIVHINTSLLERAFWRDLIYLVISRLMGTRVVYQIHGGQLPEQFEDSSRLIRFVLKRALKMADIVVVLSKEEGRAYAEYDSRINLQMIPNSIGEEAIVGIKTIATRDQPLRLVYIGRLAKSKGLDIIIGVLKRFQLNGIAVILKVAGTGPDEVEFKEAVIREGLAGIVEFVGPVFGEDKKRLWSESDVFVFPTQREGLPYALLEAMAAGVVPVTCPVGAIPDVITKETQGFLIPQGDPEAFAAAIGLLDRDRALLEKMAKGAQERVMEYYTIDRLARDFAEVYDKLMN